MITTSHCLFFKQFYGRTDVYLWKFRGNADILSFKNNDARRSVIRQNRRDGINIYRIILNIFSF